jgi:hypothetical protein
VIQERIGQAALRAYPPAVREARGLEMLGMLLDAGEQSNLALLAGRRSERDLVCRAAGDRPRTGIPKLATAEKSRGDIRAAG